MSEKKVLVTLVSINQAKEGFTFLHKGAAPKCEQCEYFHVCVKNLEPGRVYRVVGLREKRVQCESAETDMIVVEVIESEIEGAIPSKQAMEGAVMFFQTGECHKEGCENLDLCFPKGLLNGDRCQEVKITGNLRCPQGLSLTKVVLQRAPVS